MEHKISIYARAVLGAATLLLLGASATAAPPATYPFTWSTVMNNGDPMPTANCDPAAPTVPPCRTFNSYNQPSVNKDQVVVIRARSRGGQGLGEPVHGVYTRDMNKLGPVFNLLDRHTRVPQPNNRGTTFTEPPSFPRIDIGSGTVATRGNHAPVWQRADGEMVGTTGIYTNPFGALVTGGVAHIGDPVA